MIIDNTLPFCDELPSRPDTSIDTVILHCTELPTLEQSFAVAEQDRLHRSGHLYIDRDGSIYRLVPEDRVARHTRGWNERSIGIELINRGRYAEWFDSRRQVPTEGYPAPQIDALKNILGYLRVRFPSLSKLLRHSDVDLREVPSSDNPDVLVRRRIDPGPLFPWNETLSLWNGLSPR